jgi:polar amino acid transport system ATP-binding protein
VKTALPETPAIVDSGSSSEILMEIRGLYKNFGKLEVLKGINLNVHKSDVLVLIGPSGSGKSTLLRSVNMLEKPTAGQILFEGNDLTQAKRKDLCRCGNAWAWCFSSSICFPI